MAGYVRKFDENATMSFIVKNKQLLKKYAKIWKTIEGLMKINFYGDNDKYINKNICRQHNHKFS